MKLFAMRELKAAITYAAKGGQALHCHTLTMGHPMFRRYKEIAHLFDTDVNRLVKTAKKLGVRVIKVERAGTAMQHIDLCGKPFERAYSSALTMPQDSKTLPPDENLTSIR